MKRFTPLVVAVAIAGLILVLASRSPQRVGNTSLVLWEFQKILIFSLATFIVTRILRFVLGLLRFAGRPFVSPTQNAWITFALASAYFMGTQLLHRPTYATVVEATGLLPLRVSAGVIARMTNAVMMLPGLLLWLNVDLLRAERIAIDQESGALAPPSEATAKGQG